MLTDVFRVLSQPVQENTVMIDCAKMASAFFSLSFSKQPAVVKNASYVNKKIAIPLQALTGPEGSRRLRLPWRW